MTTPTPPETWTDLDQPLVLSEHEHVVNTNVRWARPTIHRKTCHLLRDTSTWPKLDARMVQVLWELERPDDRRFCYGHCCIASNSHPLYNRAR